MEIHGYQHNETKKNHQATQVTKGKSLQVAMKEYPSDAFGRLRVSETSSLSDNSFIYEHAVNLFWSNKTSGGTETIVYDKATSKQTLTVNHAGEWAASQTKQRFKYQPAKSQQVFLTGLLQKQTGIEKCYGYADLDNYNAPVIDGNIKNGIVICVKNNDVYFQIYNNGVLVDEANQENWSEDKLDGNGPSGFTLDMLYGQIAHLDLEWLGIGSVRVGFAIDGNLIYCHIFNHANRNSQNVYMRTANLPVLYLIKSTGGAGSMNQICSSVISEGGFDPKGNVFGINSSTPVAVATGNIELILGFRLKQSGFDATVIPLAVKLINRLSSSGTVFLCFNPTYTGVVTWVPLANTNIEVAENNANNVSNFGIKQFIDFVGESFRTTGQVAGEIESSLRVGKDLNGSYDECWVVFKANADANVEAIIELKDLL